MGAQDIRSGGFVFEGLEPWAPDYPNIECQVGERLFDLHNCAHFLGYTFAADGTLALAWHHYVPWDAPQPQDLVVLRFGGVRNFVATQADDWDIRAASDTEDWFYEPLEHGARLEFNVADSELAFEAVAVSFEARPLV